jgi:hypothetical protein
MQIDIRLENKAWIRFHCDVCGGHTEKDGVQPAAYVDGEQWTYVCDDCLNSGSDGMVSRLAEHAERLAAHAECLRQFAGAEWGGADREAARRQIWLDWEREKAADMSIELGEI